MPADPQLHREEDERRWTLEGGIRTGLGPSFRDTLISGPALELGASVEVVPTSQVAALRDEVERLRRELGHFKTQAVVAREAESELAAVHEALRPWWMRQESMTAARAIELLRAERGQAKASLTAQKAATTRARRRSAAGTCPCCGRTFQQLVRHEKAKHPEHAVLEPREAPNG
jgi:hypothetical protein